MSDQAQQCNVRVAVRFRPENADEKERAGSRSKSSSQKNFGLDLEQDNTVSIKVNGRDANFAFDRVLRPTATQDDVFRFAGEPAVADVLKGFNATVFAYGQTGSGKTYTMSGGGASAAPERQGLVPRCARLLFDSIRADGSGTEFTIRCSYLEIYKEILRDLLQPSNRMMRVRESPTRGVFVDGLTEESIRDEADLEDLIKIGDRSRKVATTAMNEASSRSHSLFIVKVEQKRRDGSTLSGTLNLADLAGSEKVGKSKATGETLEEAKKINQSLHALGNCINALTERGRSHVPFRDSKLTFILRESLGGNAKTALVVTCSPSFFNADESLSSLLFAQRAKKVSNTVSRNEGQSAEELLLIVKALRKELGALRKRCAELEEQLRIARASGAASGGSTGANPETEATATATATATAAAAEGAGTGNPPAAAATSGAGATAGAAAAAAQSGSSARAAKAAAELGLAMPSDDPAEQTAANDALRAELASRNSDVDELTMRLAKLDAKLARSRERSAAKLDHVIEKLADVTMQEQMLREEHDALRAAKDAGEAEWEAKERSLNAELEAAREEAKASEFQRKLAENELAALRSAAAAGEDGSAAPAGSLAGSPDSAEASNVGGDVPVDGSADPTGASSPVVQDKGDDSAARANLAAALERIAELEGNAKLHAEIRGSLEVEVSLLRTELERAASSASASAEAAAEAKAEAEAKAKAASAHAGEAGRAGRESTPGARGTPSRRVDFDASADSSAMLGVDSPGAGAHSRVAVTSTSGGGILEAYRRGGRRVVGKRRRLSSLPASNLVKLGLVRRGDRAAFGDSFVAVRDPRRDDAGGFTTFQIVVCGHGDDGRGAGRVRADSAVDAVRRRFSHFAWLHEQLSHLFPSVVIGDLPEKQTFGRFEAEFIERRRRALERFINRVASHPLLARAGPLRSFLTAQPEDWSEIMKAGQAAIKASHRSVPHESWSAFRSATQAGLPTSAVKLDPEYERTVRVRGFVADFRDRCADLQKRGAAFAEKMAEALAEANALSWAVTDVAEMVDACDAAVLEQHQQDIDNWKREQQLLQLDAAGGTGSRLTAATVASPTAASSPSARGSVSQPMTPFVLVRGDLDESGSSTSTSGDSPGAGSPAAAPSTSRDGLDAGNSSGAGKSSGAGSADPSGANPSGAVPTPSPEFSTMLRQVATQVARLAEEGAQDIAQQGEFLWDLANEYVSLSAGAKDVLSVRASLLRDYQKGNAVTTAAHEKLIKLYHEREAREIKRGGRDEKFDHKVQVQEEAFANESTKSVTAKLAFLRHSDATFTEMVRFRAQLERDVKQNFLSYLDGRMKAAASSFQEWHEIAGKMADAENEEGPIGNARTHPGETPSPVRAGGDDSVCERSIDGL